MDSTIDNITLENQDIIEYSLGHFYDIDGFLKKKYNRLLYHAIESKYSHLKDTEGHYINVPGDPTSYSKLNYLMGNMHGIAMIINYTNKRIVEAAQIGQLIASRQLDFTEPENMDEEFVKFLEILPDLIYDIIDVEGDKEFFDKLIGHIKMLGEKGKVSEKTILQFIRSCKPYIRNIETGGDGDKEDIVDGVDIKFTNRGVVETVQHKTCRSVNRGKAYYYVSQVAGLKEYDVDYMSFHTRENELYLFKNKNVSIKEYTNKFNGQLEQKYVFPIKDLEYTKQLKN